MLRTTLVILLALWLLGFILHVAGTTIHLLIGIALGVLLVEMLGSRHRAL